MSIKGSTREKRGHSSRQRVTGSAKVPLDWQGFLMNADNKKELFTYLSSKLVAEKNQRKKRIVYHRRWLCEAYWWWIFHESMQPWRSGHPDISSYFACSSNKIFGTYTNWWYWCRCHPFSKLSSHHVINPAADIWIHFHVGKTKKIIHLNSTCIAKKTWPNDLQIPRVVSCIYRLRQHICFQF